jgi:hypothetical protein
MGGYGGIFGPLLQHAEEVGFERRQEQSFNRRSQITGLENQQVTIRNNIGMLQQQDPYGKDPAIQQKIQQATDQYNQIQQQLNGLYGTGQSRRGVTAQVWSEQPPVPLTPPPAGATAPAQARPPMSEQPPVPLTPAVPPVRPGMTLEQATQAAAHLRPIQMQPFPLPNPLPPPQTEAQFMAEFRGPLSSAPPPEVFIGSGGGGGPEGPIGRATLPHALFEQARLGGATYNVPAVTGETLPSDQSALLRAERPNLYVPGMPITAPEAGPVAAGNLPEAQQPGQFPSRAYREGRRQRLLRAGRGILGNIVGRTPPGVPPAGPLTAAQLGAISPMQPPEDIMPDTMVSDGAGGTLARTRSGQLVHLQGKPPNQAAIYMQQEADAIREIEHREPTPEEWTAIQEYALGLGKAPPRAPTAKGDQVHFAPGGEPYDVTSDGVTYSRAQIEAGEAPAGPTSSFKAADKAYQAGITQKATAAEESAGRIAERQADISDIQAQEKVMIGDITERRAELRKQAEQTNQLVSLYRTIVENQKQGKSIDDTQLVLGWVRSQVQGAGRMNEVEIDRASTSGTWPERVSNWYHKWKDGRLDDSIRASMINNIRVAAQQSKYEPDDLRRQIDEEAKQDLQKINEMNAARRAKAKGGTTTATPPKTGAKPNAGKYLYRKKYEAAHKGMSKEDVDRAMQQYADTGYTIVNE